MNARLKAMGKEFPGARVDDFGFFFPSEKGGGERIEFTPDELEDGGRGPGPAGPDRRERSVPGDDANTTRTVVFVTIGQICGDVAAVASASDRKLQAPSNAILEPYRILRHGEANE